MNSNSSILLSREFQTSRDELTALPGLLEQVRRECPIAEGPFFNLMVALSEALNNAIIHGNRSDPSLMVRYRVECLEDAIRCVVEDEGEGFDPDAVADPLSPENLTREGGRGMFLIRALMRDVRIENTGHGMRVEFLCNRE